MNATRTPTEGSVGASGDLTPLSYVAAALCGERKVLFEGRVQPAAAALATIGRAPLRLRPKEGLAIMNGTAVMTALACLAWERADYVARLASRLTACNVLASAGNAHHFDAALFAVKPHAGQQKIRVTDGPHSLTDDLDRDHRVFDLLQRAEEGFQRALRICLDDQAELLDLAFFGAARKLFQGDPRGEVSCRFLRASLRQLRQRDLPSRFFRADDLEDVAGLWDLAHT